MDTPTTNSPHIDSNETYYLYTDGAYFPLLKTAGFGGIIKDSKGEPTLYFSDMTPGTEYRHQFELAAFRLGLQKAIAAKIQNLECFTDCKEMMYELTAPKGKAVHLVREIYQLFTHFEKLHISLLDRDLNTEADNLSRLSLNPTQRGLMSQTATSAFTPAELGAMMGAHNRVNIKSYRESKIKEQVKKIRNKHEKTKELDYFFENIKDLLADTRPLRLRGLKDRFLREEKLKQKESQKNNKTISSKKIEQEPVLPIEGLSHKEIYVLLDKTEEKLRLYFYETEPSVQRVSSPELSLEKTVKILSYQDQPFTESSDKIFEYIGKGIENIFQHNNAATLGHSDVSILTTLNTVDEFQKIFNEAIHKKSVSIDCFKSLVVKNYLHIKGLQQQVGRQETAKIEVVRDCVSQRVEEPLLSPVSPVSIPSLNLSGRTLPALLSPLRPR